MAESVYTYDSLEVAVDQLRFQYPKVSLVATADNPEYLIFCSERAWLTRA